MRSDARKRLQAAQHKPAPVRVYCSNFDPPWADWEGVCDATCNQPLNVTAGSHNDALEVALGHVCLHHPRRCDHSTTYVIWGRAFARCLSCGKEMS